MRDQMDKMNRLKQFGAHFLFISVFLWFLCMVYSAHKETAANDEIYKEVFKGLNRTRRFVYMDSNRSMRLPTGSIFAWSNVCSLPFLGNLPIGYGSGLTVSVPITVNFDELGLTSPDNRFGYFDWMNMSHMMPQVNMSAFNITNILSNVANYTWPDWGNPFPSILPYHIKRRRRSLDAWDDIPGINYAGGDRKLVYEALEGVANYLNVDGEACLERFICELHIEPLVDHGFLGEVTELLMTPSYAAFAEKRFPKFLKAEKHGKTQHQCRKYEKKCKFTAFRYFPWHHLEQLFASSKNSSGQNSNSIHHRSKRFFFFGPNRRLLLPPSTAVVGTPTLNLPFWRDLPKGYKSQLSYSIPFTLDFDGLSLTSILNTFGNIPFLRKKRSIGDQQSIEDYPGGDREYIYAVLAYSLSNLRFNGHGCLLRTICEINEAPIFHHGLFGELFELLFSPSQSPDANKRLFDFVKAEELGKNCGDCSVYDGMCQSIFNNPGVGLRHSTEKERIVCKKKYFNGIRETNEDFIKRVKSKYKNMPKLVQGHTDFAQDIAHKLQLQDEQRSFRDMNEL